MKPIIHYDTLRKFCYSNDKICKKPIKGIVINFCWLNQRDMFMEDTENGRFYAENNILFVFPYCNPWAWMNRQTVALTDEIIKVLMEQYQLPEDLPRTMYSAFGSYDMSMEEALRTVSPIHLCEENKMPEASYYIFHGEKDQSVNIEKHSEKLVKALQKKTSVVFHRVPDKGHCELTEDMSALYQKYICDSILDIQVKQYRVQ